MTRQQWLGKAYNSARWGDARSRTMEEAFNSTDYAFNCVSKRTVLVLWESCPPPVKVKPPPVFLGCLWVTTRMGAGLGKPEGLSGSTAGLESHVFCPEDRKSFAPSLDGAFRSLNVWRWYGQEDRCWRQPTGHFFLTMWSQISQRLGVESCPPTPPVYMLNS